MIWFSLWIQSLILQYMRCKYALSFILPWAPHIAIIRSRVKKGKLMPWWGHIHIEWSERIKWGAKQGLFWKLIAKPQSYLTWRAEVIWFMTIPFLNYPRWHDRHSTKFTSARYGLEYLLCLLHTFGYHVSPWSDSLYSGRAKVKCGGVVDGC